MADEMLKTLTLGTGGVNLDADPFQIADNQVQFAQNATSGQIAGAGGALVCRPGLARFNTVAFAGAVLGGIGMPVVGLGGAPPVVADPNGPTGTPPPGGPITTPGSPTPPTSGGTGGTGSGSLFTPTRIFNGARVVVLGRTDSRGASSTGGNSWFVIDQNLVDAAVIDDVAALGLTPQYGFEAGAGPPGGPTFASGHLMGALAAGSPPTAVVGGNLYYPQGTSASPSVTPVLPVLRRLSADGMSDKAVITIPDNPVILNLSPVPSHGVNILSILPAYGDATSLYLSTYDYVNSGALSGAGSLGSYGRVVKVSGLDSGSYTITEIFNSLNTNANAALNGIQALPVVPNALSIFLGQLFLGLWRGQTGLAVGPSIALLRPDPTQPDGYGVTQVLSNANAGAADVACMQAYNGLLYVGYVYDAATLAPIYSFAGSPGGAVLAKTPTGSAGQNPNGWVSMTVFNNLLLASFYNPNGSRAQIYRFDGTTWTVSWVDSGTAATIKPLTFAVDNGTVYAIGGTLLLWSLDGITWTDASAQLPSTGSGSAIPILFGYAQS